MSRTFKTRPHWVRANDPKERKSTHHKHITIHTEHIGQEKYIDTPAYSVVDDNGEFLYYVPEYSWMVDIYDSWAEYIGCNIDEPMTKDQNWGREGCWTYALDLGYGWPRHKAKQAVSQARRHNVKQQLRLAVLNDDWDLDINENPLYAKNMWWD